MRLPVAVPDLIVRSEMRRATSAVTLASGIAGLIIAVLLGLLQWRIIWLANHGTMFIDWSPYPEFLAMSLNWWVPISLIIIGKKWSR